MATYTAPGVYVEDVYIPNPSSDSAANSVGCLIGVTKSGDLHTPTLITSFNEFCEKFASGLKTPYMSNSYLTYCVAGFFNNGGKQLFINRIAKSTATKSQGTITHINSGDNPSEEGWYTHDTDLNKYIPSTDTQVVSGTTYYEVTATSHTAEGSENPSALNWYTLADNIYTLSTDETCTEGDTFYTIVATAQTPSGSTTVTDVTFTAQNEGTWGDNLVVKIKKSADWTESDLVYDVTVDNEDDSVTLMNVYYDTFKDSILNHYKLSKWIGEIDIEPSYTALTEATVTFSGGNDGLEGISDTDYTKGLEDLGSHLEDIMFVAIPGQTSSTVNNAIISYCDENFLFPLLDMPKGSSVGDTKAYRRTLTHVNGGALNYPWIESNDPLTEGTILLPTCGHVMGVYARIIETRGMHKAPAGTSAVIKGAIALERELTEEEIGILNPIGVVCLCAKRNIGIVIWGARGLNSFDASLRYVTDVIINYNIRRVLYQRTQFSVFEPNTDTLWSRLVGVCTDYLENLRLNGTLKGSASEAYYVVCDESNNTEASIAAGECHIDIGYAPVKPAEFVVIRLAHSMAS